MPGLEKLQQTKNFQTKIDQHRIEETAAVFSFFHFFKEFISVPTYLLLEACGAIGYSKWLLFKNKRKKYDNYFFVI